MKNQQWYVHKFGGTSLANAECFRRVGKIVEQEPGQYKGVVVSAMSGVTNALLDLVDFAEKQDKSYVARLKILQERHLQVYQELIGDLQDSEFAMNLEKDLIDIGSVLNGISVLKSASSSTREIVSGYGELWSAQILATYLNQSQHPTIWLDARQVLVVQPSETGRVVDWDVTRSKFKQWNAQLAVKNHWVVITGYIASDRMGGGTTLQRNGSDYSAAIFGNLFDASRITIWTDVDGVMSADPRKVPEAFVLNELSYNEAMELAFFGAKIIHPSTIAPAVAKKIPVSIRNTFRPEFSGTTIVQPSAEKETQFLVKGFASIDQVSLISLEGSGMLGVPGVAERLFGALKSSGVSVILISQASSEQSICFAVPTDQGVLAKAVAEKTFFFEIKHHQVQRVVVTGPCSILAAVGDSMVESPGVSARFFSALGRAGVNVRAIAQGSSERNISAVIDEGDAVKALRAVHAGFYLSNQTLSVGLVGPGLIGRTLLEQFSGQLQKLKEQMKIDIRLRGIIDSKKMLLADTPIDAKNWEKLFQESNEVPDFARFADHIKASHLPHAAIIDCTASDKVAREYSRWMQKGLHIVTPNKKANSGELAYYRELQSLKARHNVHYLYETTVGAGLPVINTLRDLVQTGDTIEKIEGIFSGTLSYLFNEYDGRKSFSEIVNEAKAKGYTEPDPRDDLSGLDVARKTIILGREMGLELELADIEIESLVPPGLEAIQDVEQFLIQLKSYDEPMNRRLKAAKDQGGVLRYVGLVNPKGKSRVELRVYPQDHAFAGIAGSDNVISFTTSRYLHQSLIVRGPGAGPEVTAGGVFADLLRLANSLGASL